MKFSSIYTSPIGKIILEADESALTGLRFEDRNISTEYILLYTEKADHPVIRTTRSWLDAYFSGRIPDGVLPTRPEGTPFQQDVWDILRAVPYGKTTTYGEIARRIAAARGLESMSARAVGAAAGRNPIPIIIPCHRVVGAGGALTGYSGGIGRKKWLLEREGV